ncbi:MAG: HAD family hydrolase [Bacteroidales bacterium]|nr:HAD family hydrolase [Bacteroidales bacterium]
MKRPITTLLFDFDGTLADTTRTILKTMSLTIVELGLPLPPETQMKSGIGLPLRACIQKAGNVPEELADRAAELYHKFFKQVAFGTENIEALKIDPGAEGAAVLYDGVKETLEWLRAQGYVLGIATSRRWDTLQLFLRHFGIMDLFGAIVTVEDVAHPKPAPDTVLYDLEKLNRRPEETLVVGDATYDILMGRNAGCRTCAVSYGNQGRDLLQTASPDWIIDSMRELPELL